MKLPQDKLASLRQHIHLFLNSKKATLKSFQSLIGMLNFACKVIAPGQAFLRRLIDATIGVNQPHFRIRINRDIKADLTVWQQFLANFNGVSVITSGLWVTDSCLQLFTDAAGGPRGGFGIYFAGNWAHSCWPLSWIQSDIIRDLTFLEIFPVYVAIRIWFPHLSNKRILFHVDNSAVVQVLNTATSKSARVMHIVRKLVLLNLQHNITIKAQYIPSKSNSIADSISRSQWRKFRRLAPEADQQPTPLPNQLWDI